MVGSGSAPSTCSRFSSGPAEQPLEPGRPPGRLPLADRLPRRQPDRVDVGGHRRQRLLVERGHLVAVDVEEPLRPVVRRQHAPHPVRVDPLADVEARRPVARPTMRACPVGMQVTWGCSASAAATSVWPWLPRGVEEDEHVVDAGREVRGHEELDVLEGVLDRRGREVHGRQRRGAARATCRRGVLLKVGRWAADVIVVRVTGPAHRAPQAGRRTSRIAGVVLAVGVVIALLATVRLSGIAAAPSEARRRRPRRSGRRPQHPVEHGHACAGRSLSLGRRRPVVPAQKVLQATIVEAEARQGAEARAGRAAGRAGGGVDGAVRGHHRHLQRPRQPAHRPRRRPAPLPAGLGAHARAPPA